MMKLDMLLVVRENIGEKMCNLGIDCAIRSKLEKLGMELYA